MLVNPSYISDPTPEERRKAAFTSRLRKAKHLSARVHQFLDDLNGGGFKATEKQEIINALYEHIPFKEIK